MSDTFTQTVGGRYLENNTWARVDMEFIFERLREIPYLQARPCIILFII